MRRGLRSTWRLFVILRCLARHGALAPFQEALANAGLAPVLLALIRLVFGRADAGRRPGERRSGERLAAALAELGPAFIKLGQTLATRSDLLGETVAADLATLQDRLPPFSAFAAKATIAAELGGPVERLFAAFEERPVSAASISQVHFAVTPPEAGCLAGRAVAVKILRPGIEAAFQRDVDLLLWVAETIERTQPRLRRLKPVAVVKTFAATVRVEMDLRLEAAAASELRDNFAGDPTYRVPAIDWRRTARRVLTQERVQGIRMDDAAAMREAGLDVDDVLAKAAAIFFNQVFRDGYFHGDQHPGNMTVGADGVIQAVDFGIMGRLDQPTRAYLADMLLGFLERDYRRIARVHAEAGYLPQAQRIEDFALALRAVGEPIQDKPLNEISFAAMLGRVFAIAEAFEMEVQPQLLLLQKNMLIAEGVSRRLNPALNIWALARPLIERWMVEHRSPPARLLAGLRDALETAERLPALVRSLEHAARRLAGDGAASETELRRLKEARERERRRRFLLLWLTFLAFGLALLLR